MKNAQQKQELDNLRTYCSIEKESKTIICNQFEKIKSELSLKKQSLNLLVKKLNNEVFGSNDENINSLEVWFNI